MQHILVDRGKHGDLYWNCGLAPLSRRQGLSVSYDMARALVGLVTARYVKAISFYGPLTSGQKEYLAVVVDKKYAIEYRGDSALRLLDLRDAHEYEGWSIEEVQELRYDL